MNMIYVGTLGFSFFSFLIIYLQKVFNNSDDGRGLAGTRRTLKKEDSWQTGRCIDGSHCCSTHGGTR